MTADRIGLLGPLADPQLQAVAEALTRRGAEPVWINSEALELQRPVWSDDGILAIDGVALQGLTAIYVRSLPSPHAPLLQRDGRWLQRDGDHVLRRDWYSGYMQSRERVGFLTASLLCLEASGVRLVNPLQSGMASQSKPLQLELLRRLGAPVPRTLISNDPGRIRDFHARESARGSSVIYKPLLGGALTRPLDRDVLEHLEQVRAAPVIFQQRVDGDDIRVMVVGDAVVSAVAIKTPEPHLDFRGDPAYRAGTATYAPVELPGPLALLCCRATAACGLRFAGLDLKRAPDGSWVVLELNSSPIYLDVERKMGDPISDALAGLLLNPGIADAYAAPIPQTGQPWSGAL
jgi:glutathione synthase/RimK-type ligase-like ATP-grasp enzyme